MDHNNKDTASSKRAEEAPKQTTERTKFTMSAISSISDNSTMAIPIGELYNFYKTTKNYVDEQRIKKEDDGPVSDGDVGTAAARVKEEDQEVKVMEEMGNDNEDAATESTTATDKGYNEWGTMLAQHASAVAERERTEAAEDHGSEELGTMLAQHAAAVAGRQHATVVEETEDDKQD